jgi:hypothetical protein
MLDAYYQHHDLPNTQRTETGRGETKKWIIGANTWNFTPLISLRAALRAELAGIECARSKKVATSLLNRINYTTSSALYVPVSADYVYLTRDAQSPAESSVRARDTDPTPNLDADACGAMAGVQHAHGD